MFVRQVDETNTSCSLLLENNDYFQQHLEYEFSGLKISIIISSLSLTAVPVLLLKSLKASKKIHSDHMSLDIMHNTSPLPPSPLDKPACDWTGWHVHQQVHPSTKSKAGLIIRKVYGCHDLKLKNYTKV